MNLMLVNYESADNNCLFKSELINVDGSLKDYKLILFYNKNSKISLNQALKLKRLRKNMEFIGLSDATLESINFNLSVLLGYYKEKYPNDKIITITNDNQCASAIKYLNSDIKLTSSVECAMNNNWLKIAYNGTLAYPVKSLDYLKTNEVLRKQLQKKINSTLSINGFSHLLGKSSKIMNVFINSKDLEEFKQALTNAGYSEALELYSVFKKDFIKARNTKQIV